MKTEFIHDKRLRKRIETSIEYILTLYEAAQASSVKSYKSETYRVIVLYCVSIIEALLLSIHQNRTQKITCFEYVGANELTEKYKHITHDGKVIIAVRREREKSESEIGLHEIVSFFENKMLKPKTVERIKKINNLRNSFHLRKDGVDTCTVEDVEESLALLNLALTHVPRFVK